MPRRRNRSQPREDPTRRVRRPGGPGPQRGGNSRPGRADAAAAQREALERRWFRGLADRPDLAALVTGESLRDEPLHRWFAYKLAFAPQLVRLFLRETTQHSGAGLRARESDDHSGAGLRARESPILDPFAGSGTLPIECARRGVAAVGVEALQSLAFLASARSATSVPDLPELPGCETPPDFAARLHEPIHRAALLCAVARRHGSDGKPLADAPPLHELLAEAVAMMRDDLRSPLPAPVRVIQGDARNLAGIADAAIGGILTSPPYLSRHDYTRITRPIEEVFALWRDHDARAPAEPGASEAAAKPAEPGAGEAAAKPAEPGAGEAAAARRDAQVRAHPRAYARPWRTTPHPAVVEICEALREAGERKLAGVTRSYFEDMTAALRECARVLVPGGPCWIVIGGARLKDVYVPADLILADLAGHAGFDVAELRVARRLIPSGRKLGTLRDVAPRETLLVLRRRA